MRRLLVCAALLGVSGCTCGKPGTALEVQITLEGLQPACLEVQVQDDADATRTGSATVTISGRKQFVVGIDRAKDWSTQWSVSVLAREGSCQGNVVARADRPGIEVPEGKVTQLEVTLQGVDADGDGYAAISSGGTDCDDGDATRSPGVRESCADGIDNDCDGLIDCADPDCAGASCNDGNSCTTSDACAAGTCAGTSISCGAPPVDCRQSAGSCTQDAGCQWPLAPVGTPCDGGVCNNGGTCSPPDTELNCADGIDDPSDLDTLADCADSDCLGAPCDAGPCVGGATCQANGACTGAAKSCGATGQCHDAGTCDNNTGLCSSPLSPPGSACDDGDPCTTDSCSASGVCQGVALVCTAPNLCTASVCDGGTCVVSAVNNGGACDDDAGCTFTDVCAAGVCGGTTYSCTAPPDCRQPGVCLGDGGCGFAVATDSTPCDGGSCQSGNCVATSSFPYKPLNFDPASLAPLGAVVIDCTVEFDSTGGSAPSWCSGALPAVLMVTMDGGVLARVIAAQSLIITDAGTLNMHGGYPVILAVYSTGVTLIDGPVLAATDGVADAGTGTRSVGQCTTEAGGNSVNPDHGGGGGGYGTPGAAGAFLGVAGDAGPTWPEPLLGGCPGGPSTSGAEPGKGGGAIQISVAGTLRLGAGGVSASGGGGNPGHWAATPHGGGGGGSGGVILLEANVLDLTATTFLTANGGAGGEGGDDNEDGGAGQSGSIRGSTFATSPNLANQGGNGGRGGTRGGLPAVGSGSMSNGGSGGAVGRVFVRSATAACTVTTPAAQLSPPYQLIGPNCPASP